MLLFLPVEPAARLAPRSVPINVVFVFPTASLASAEVDLEDLRAHTVYSGGFTKDSRTVQLFWSVVSGFSAEERRALLKFVTSCSRPPLQGFRHLHPAFTIHKVDCEAAPWAQVFGQDVERLPSASTCFCTLKLPNYRRAGTMREKLLCAINSGAGFDLS